MFEDQYAYAVAQQMNAWPPDYERAAYEKSMQRGPMIEADIDWLAPNPLRQMIEGDL